MEWKNEYRIPNATQYSANEIALRLDLGIGTSTDAARMMSDAIMELYQKKGLEISASTNHLKNVEFHHGSALAPAQTKAQEMATDAVLTALEEDGVPVKAVSEEELKVLGGKVQLCKKQKKMLSSLSAAANAIKGWLTEGKRGKSFTFNLPNRTLEMIR